MQINWDPEPPEGQRNSSTTQFTTASQCYVRSGGAWDKAEQEKTSGEEKVKNDLTKATRVCPVNHTNDVQSHRNHYVSIKHGSVLKTKAQKRGASHVILIQETLWSSSSSVLTLNITSL